MKKKTKKTNDEFVYIGHCVSGGIGRIPRKELEEACKKQKVVGVAANENKTRRKS